METMMVALDDTDGLSPRALYDRAITEIAEHAPLRIVTDGDGMPLELLSGAATLGAAIRHTVPASVDGVNALDEVLTIHGGTAIKTEDGFDVTLPGNTGLVVVLEK